MKTKKRNRKKRLITIWMMVMMIVSCFLTACSSENDDDKSQNSYNFEVTNATSEFYVNDFANLFSNEQKEEMMSKAENLDEEYGGIQVVVTTVDSLEKTITQYNNNMNLKNLEIEQVSYAMFSQYGIGTDDMGILILFSTGDREVRIETGKMMQTYITDSKSGQLLDDYGMDYFRNNQFADGLVALQGAVIDEIKGVVPSDWNVNNQTSQEKVSEEEMVSKEETNEGNSIMGVILGLFFAIVAIVGSVIAHIKNVMLCNSKIDAEKVKREKELAKQESKFNEKINFLQEKLQQTIREKERLEKEIAESKDFYARVQALYPEKNFEEEVHQMIEDEFKASALKIDKQIEMCIDMFADKDSIAVFKEAINAYEQSDSDVKKYVTSDIQKLYRLYEDSKKLKIAFEKAEQEKRDRLTAHKAESEAQAIIDRISSADEDDRDELERALRFYTGLSMAQQAYFNVNLVKKIKNLRDDADEDHRRKENKRREEARHREEQRRREEERRREESRRRDSFNSMSSSHHSSISHSGHGGRSSGGGASRKF